MSSEPTSAPAPKRRRIERSPSPAYKLDDEANDDYEPYVPVAQRRQAKLAQLAAAAGGEGIDRARAAKEKQEREEREDAEREAERTRERARQERTLLLEAQEVHERKRAEDAKKTADERADEADAEILAAIASRRKLASDLELAKGIQYTDTLKTSYVISYQESVFGVFITSS
jgi:ATP-dependent RNA helicase DDX41